MSGDQGPLDPRERFTGNARAYARFRPGYPESLVDWVVLGAGVGPGDPVADIGCGTGIFTRLLAARGLDVVGIDPNEDMLAEASAAGRARFARGEAAATGLADASVTLVTAAQAFHWFELEPTLVELQRVLRPGGHVAAVWNLRGTGRLMDAYEALLRRFSSQYEVLDRWEDTLERLRAHPRVRSPRQTEVTNAQSFDLEGLRGRSWSSSYVRHGVADAAGFDAALAELFERRQRKGVVAFPYRAVALLFQLA